MNFLSVGIFAIKFCSLIRRSKTAYLLEIRPTSDLEASKALEPKKFWCIQLQNFAKDEFAILRGCLSESTSLNVKERQSRTNETLLRCFPNWQFEREGEDFAMKETRNAFDF